MVVLPLLISLAFYSSLSIVATSASPFRFGNLQQNGNLVFVTTVNETQVTTAFNESAFLNPPSFPFSLSLPTLPLSVLVIFIVAMCLALSLGLFRNLRRSGRTVTEFQAGDESSPTDKKDREEVAQIIDVTIQKLRQGSSYRETVLECYRQITSILELKSKVQGSPMTPREFDKAMSDRLKLPEGSSLSRVTSLFEIARYSEHPVTQDEANSAIECLSDLSKLLRI